MILKIDKKGESVLSVSPAERRLINQMQSLAAELAGICKNRSGLLAVAAAAADCAASCSALIEELPELPAKKVKEAV